MTDTDILEPSIDPKTRKIGVRHVSATNAGGTRSKVQVRDFLDDATCRGICGQCLILTARLQSLRPSL